MGHPVRIELTREGLLIELANLAFVICIAIYKALCFDVAQGPMRLELTRVGLLV